MNDDDVTGGEDEDREERWRALRNSRSGLASCYVVYRKGIARYPVFIAHNIFSGRINPSEESSGELCYLSSFEGSMKGIIS